MTFVVRYAGLIVFEVRFRKSRVSFPRSRSKWAVTDKRGYVTDVAGVDRTTLLACRRGIPARCTENYLGAQIISSSGLTECKPGSAIHRVDDGHVLNRFFRCRLKRLTPEHCVGEGIKLVRIGGGPGGEVLHSLSVG